MSWQIDYALRNLNEGSAPAKADHLHGDFIRVPGKNRPDAVVAVSESELLDLADVNAYHQAQPDVQFICGYRKECIWTGEAIGYLQAHRIGWGNFGTLQTAVYDDNLRNAEHKVYFFSDRLLRQIRTIRTIVRQFDRVYQIELGTGRAFRLGMLFQYEPTAETVRTFVSQFGHTDILWNINPNGTPSTSAKIAAKELGCEVMKWEELRQILKST